MSHANQHVSTESNPLLGIGLKVASVCAFLGMAALIKLAGQLPAGQITFYRSFWAIWPILIYLITIKQFKDALKTQYFWGHLSRGAVGVMAMGLGFYALTRIPLPDAVALGYARPLITIILGALILGEVVRRYRWGAVVFGFVGVIIISWPKLELLRGSGGLQSEQALGVLAMLGHALLASVAVILVRQLVKTESTSTIVLYFSLTACVISLISFPFGWETMSWPQFGFLMGAGFLGGLGQITVTQSYRFAETSTIAPFEYTSILLSLALGIWLFSEIPTSGTIIGSVIIIASGMFIIYREHILGLKRAKERKSGSIKAL